MAACVAQTINGYHLQYLQMEEQTHRVLAASVDTLDLKALATAIERSC